MALPVTLAGLCYECSPGVNIKIEVAHDHDALFEVLEGDRKKGIYNYIYIISLLITSYYIGTNLGVQKCHSLIIYHHLFIAEIIPAIFLQHRGPRCNGFPSYSCTHLQPGMLPK